MSVTASVDPWGVPVRRGVPSALGAPVGLKKREPNGLNGLSRVLRGAPMKNWLMLMKESLFTPRTGATVVKVGTPFTGRKYVVVVAVPMRTCGQKLVRLVPLKVLVAALNGGGALAEWSALAVKSRSRR